MCDYSLELYKSRGAAKDETLSLHRFPSGTVGFVGAPVGSDGNPSKTAMALDTECAVCIPAGTKLKLSGLSQPVQSAFSVGSIEQVTMTRLEGGKHAHNDAVTFQNGRQVLLQSLNSGVTAKLVPIGQASIDDIKASIENVIVEPEAAPREHHLIEAGG